jgi:low temperature requirement protein LtrA
MVARSPDEEHRTATALELFFDLCFVIAVAQASAGLHHAVVDDHAAQGVVGYLGVFFAIWWAWMMFTWFASAYDNDDIPYRLATLVQIAGVLILAAGVPRALDGGDYGVITLGYVVMRLAMVSQWLRAARADERRRATCLRYAAGVTLVQVGWVARLAIPDQGPWGWARVVQVVLIAAELAVPVWAERAGMTPWHPRHIAERYGLFTLIVLGESLLAATVAAQSALDAEAAFGELATTATGGLLTVFGMWWLYFAKGASRQLASLRSALVWGYGHYLVFASAAAVGAGLAVSVDVAAQHAKVGELVAGAAFTVPVAVFLLTVWALQLRPHHLGTSGTWGTWRAAVVPLAALAVLGATFTPQPVLLTGLAVAAAVAVSLAAEAARAQPVS